MAKKLSAWADISGDIHIEIRDGDKRTQWDFKGVESTSSRRFTGNQRLANMFFEIAAELSDRATPTLPAPKLVLPVEAVGDDPPRTSPSPGELKLAAKAEAVTVQGGKWFNGDDLDIPFMAPNGKEVE